MLIHRLRGVYRTTGQKDIEEAEWMKFCVADSRNNRKNLAFYKFKLIRNIY
jgi:hypothetical protein